MEKLDTRPPKITATIQKNQKPKPRQRVSESGPRLKRQATTNKVTKMNSEVRLVPNRKEGAVEDLFGSKCWSNMGVICRDPIRLRDGWDVDWWVHSGCALSSKTKLYTGTAQTHPDGRTRAARVSRLSNASPD